MLVKESHAATSTTRHVGKAKVEHHHVISIDVLCLEGYDELLEREPIIIIVYSSRDIDVGITYLES